MSDKLTSDAIRASFLEFFQQHGHTVVPSAGVIPRNDRTLLFTNAGMVQFKDVFLGEDKRPYTRAASSQKCIRMSGKHNDLENVGRTARHHTFFEMLGNFSFGDYFKREAIALAWELLTRVWRLPKERLVITVFKGEPGLPADDEARTIWKEVTGFGDDRIFGLGREDNFWSMGDTGPCGPCTEIHYFMGEGAADPKTFGDEPAPNGAGWMEIWNLVFMQFNRLEKDGPLTPLPAPCVDTGMGLERITAVLQSVTSNYDTDLLRALVDRAAEIAGRPYQPTQSEYDTACRVIADHARMAAFSLAEGITPSNKDRGAALRSVMRRAIRNAYLQGLREPTFHKVAETVIDRMGGAYPELVQHREFIVDQCRAEDLRFRETIPTGLELLSRFDGWVEGASGTRELPGEVAFDLYATHGFPLDLTELIGQERGFVVDHEGYRRARAQHSEVSKGDDHGGISKEEKIRVEHREALLRAGGSVAFTGYTALTERAPIVALLRPDEKGALHFVDALTANESGQVVVGRTPFYGESGGQVGDRGVITGAAGEFIVSDTLKPVSSLIIHAGTVTSGQLKIGDEVTLTVDAEARNATRRNHSATHLLHWALRKVLGPHAQQKGSKVAPEGLRFDYAASRPLSDDEVVAIEDLVNKEILDNRGVETVVTSQAEARKRGAMMIFEEKYGDEVRMLHIGRESVELCGGTHVAATGDIGLFKIVSDQNLGAGVRRVEAVTGLGALGLVRALSGTLRRVADTLKTSQADVLPRVEKTLEHQRELQHQIDELKRKLMTGGGSAENISDVAGLKLIVAKAPVHEDKALREYADHLRDKHGDAVVVVGAATADQKALLVVATTKALAGRVHAGKLVGQLAALVGGRGGGRPDMAAAGGPDASKLDATLEQAASLLASQLT
ncbi:MAG: alanine--tRNA ligase [Myxococcales bacterium]|nr:alanine--tRNA ligase [Myxococcales bacterium]